MKCSLVVMSQGRYQGRAITIRKPQFVIGRDPGCDLRPESAFVSHRHCAILSRGERAFVDDSGSTNGTFVNERQIHGEAELKNGDELRIESLLFRVRLEGSTGSGEATAMPQSNQPAVAQGDEGRHPDSAPESRGDIPAERGPVEMSKEGTAADFLLS